MILLYGWLQHAIAIQRDIYTAFGDKIGAFASTGDWGPLLVYLPVGIVFGAVHAMTPGHSKAVLATYLAGSTASVPRAMLVSWTLSFVHIAMAVLVALFARQLVSVDLGSVGRAPVLEVMSRALLGLIGLWMLWQAWRGMHDHGKGEGALVGFMAGLIPCPLTLFVMTFAIVRGVPLAGVAFAGTMLIGVALTLSVVALASVIFRRQLLHLFARWPRLLDAVLRGIQVTAGLVLVALATSALISP